MNETTSKLLEDFVLDNAELEQLESLVNPFNVFEAIGVVGHELRHSDFLAYLFNPRQNHGLGDAFFRRLLKRVVSNAPKASVPFSAIEVDVWKLEHLEVVREWENIDILLKDETNKFVVAIENKIETTEHSNQLERYLEILSLKFSGWKILAIYLTPDGDAPSNVAYLPIGYGLVATVLESLSEGGALSLNPDVALLIRHYVQILRRHVMTESDIAELCRKVYWKHKKAIDLIFEHRPDEQAAIKDILTALIQERNDLVLDNSSKRYVRFAVKEWDKLPRLKAEKGWSSEGRLLLFEFQNEPTSLKLKLILGPGPQHIRAKLFKMAQSSKPFKPPSKNLMNQWNELFSLSILSAQSYEDVDEDQFKVKGKVRQHWEEFLKTSLPEIEAAIQSQHWLNEVD